MSLIDLGHHVAQGDAGSERRLDRDHTLAVLALDHRRGILLLHAADLLEFHGAPLPVVKRDVLHVPERHAERFGIAHHDVVFVAVLAVFRGHEAVDAVAHGLRRRGAVHAVIRQGGHGRRPRCSSGRRSSRESCTSRVPSRPPSLLLQVVGNGVGHVHVVAENLDVDRRRTAHAARYRRRASPNIPAPRGCDPVPCAAGRR